MKAGRCLWPSFWWCRCACSVRSPGVDYAKMDINVFTQIGFVVLIGLASKNAILIVEFAKARREAGVDRRTATLQACELRLRPIMMTSFAFILGVLPLVVAHGAGAEMRRTLGTAVFSGMLGVTLFGIFLTPVFFYVIDRVAEWHAFSTGWIHRSGVIALDVLRLGFIRRPARRLVEKLVVQKPSPKPGNGGTQPARTPHELEAASGNGAHSESNGASAVRTDSNGHPANGVNGANGTHGDNGQSDQHATESNGTAALPATPVTTNAERE